MSIREAGTFARHYALIGAMLASSWFVSSQFSTEIDKRIHAAGEADMLLILFGMVIIFALGFLVYELAKPTFLPSFVLAIFFGIVARDILGFLVESPLALSTLITVGAVLILFGGGLETPFTKFKKLLGPILSLAIVGTLLNAFLFSFILASAAHYFGITLPLAVNVLLGAAVASTDPAAIIPSFQSLVFKKPRVKHIAISESAINDVVGAVLVTVFLTLFSSSLKPINIVDAYAQLFSADNLLFLLNTVIIGLGIGMVGFGILQVWSKSKARVYSEEGSDAALFLGVPLFSFTLASILGGSGFLAVFLSGLFFHMKVHFRHVEHYFNHTIEGFMKPLIFMLLGAMVEPSVLLDVAGIGITVGLMFMFVLRPLIVFLALVPFCVNRQHMSIKELLFLSFVRETGVIPAALLITISLAGLEGTETAMAIGLWVILLTLIIQPPLTPLVARKLNIAKNVEPLPARKHTGPVAVLCSRGMSFPARMKTVVDWAEKHHIENVALLHCPEQRYTEGFVEEVRCSAEEIFATINERLQTEGKKEMHFEYLSGKGLLQDNIEQMIEDGDVSIIFVGSKMLDFRLNDVKRLNTPFFFLP